jgi:hypothetical protein
VFGFFCEKLRHLAPSPLPYVKNPEDDSFMRKEKLQTDKKSNPSIPRRAFSRPENVSTKHNKQTAHHAPVRRAASKGRGF